MKLTKTAYKAMEVIDACKRRNPGYTLLGIVARTETLTEEPPKGEIQTILEMRVWTSEHVPEGMVVAVKECLMCGGIKRPNEISCAWCNGLGVLCEAVVRGAT